MHGRALSMDNKVAEQCVKIIWLTEPFITALQCMYLFAASSFCISLIIVLTFSPRADLDLFLSCFLFPLPPGTGDAVGDSVLPSVSSCSFVTEKILCWLQTDNDVFCKRSSSV